MKHEVASGVEKFLVETIVPEVFSNQGRISILATYIVLFIVAVYGVSQVKIDFKTEYFIKPDARVYNFFQLNDAYFRTGFTAVTYVDNPSLDFTNKET